MVTQLAEVMPGLRLDPSESKLSISHTSPEPSPLLTTTTSTAIVLVHCHYTQELWLRATGNWKATFVP